MLNSSALLISLAVTFGSASEATTNS
jgi:hypothetical protein